MHFNIIPWNNLQLYLQSILCLNKDLNASFSKYLLKKPIQTFTQTEPKFTLLHSLFLFACLFVCVLLLLFFFYIFCVFIDYIISVLVLNTIARSNSRWDINVHTMHLCCNFCMLWQIELSSKYAINPYSTRGQESFCTCYAESHRKYLAEADEISRG